MLFSLIYRRFPLVQAARQLNKTPRPRQGNSNMRNYIFWIQKIPLAIESKEFFQMSRKIASPSKKSELLTCQPSIAASVSLRHCSTPHNDRGIMAYFQRINTVDEFNQYAGVQPSGNLSYLPARLFHNGRYLPGYVEASLQVGSFIYTNESQQNVVYGVGSYGFDLLLNWEDNLEWRLHLLEHELDLVDAFPADPLTRDEFLYFGRCKLNGIYYYGPVRSNGMIYILTPEGTLRELPEFDILVYKQSKIEGRKMNGAHAEIKVIPAEEVLTD